MQKPFNLIWIKMQIVDDVLKWVRSMDTFKQRASVFNCLSEQYI